MLGYGTRAHPLELNLMSTHSLGYQSSGLGFATSLSSKPKTHGKGRRMEKTHFQLGEDEFLLSLKISAGGYISEVSRVHRMTRGLTLLLSHRRLVLAFNIFTFWTIGLLRILEQRVEFVLLVNRQRCLAILKLQLPRSFQPFCSFLRLSPFKKGVSNSATQDSIMNALIKTQITYARNNCVLKDSSCDTPLPKILMLAILATCASSSSTKCI
ncbi:hypothetical protein H5410_061177 [Solanum commersonii]|uniref:Uncharacterized protein n=1 Tax=Solanum commersonii TaxID=4109 RepID=A0A9J5W6Z4_SOLCO|nr:hypothetical protein H5410_061177 [Solanum commersonii]